MRTEYHDEERASRRGPVLMILLLAPFFGETLSTSTRPLDLVLPWNLAPMVALYGCGALLCRELARRYGLGLLGLCLLAAAYAVYEEALVDGYWFDRRFADAVGVGSYGWAGGTNLLLAAHLMVFHVAVSIGSSVLVVERVYPDLRDQAWLGRRGTVVAGIVLALVLPGTWFEFARGPIGPVLGAVGLMIVLVGCAVLVGRRGPGVSGVGRRPHPRLLGVIAFTATAAHFLLVYGVPATGLAWPLGLVVTLVPIPIGILLVRRLATSGVAGSDGLWTLTGILSFFVLLDIAVGLAGSYDLAVAGLTAAAGLWWVHCRRAPVGARTDPTEID